MQLDYFRVQKSPVYQQTGLKLEAEVGIEPTNVSFANW